ncbi:MAG: hypothetical protein NWR73_01245 [Flavobacteriales bacterium]|nr:hypothetical protein [Flavobacteriales bacterium]
MKYLALTLLSAIGGMLNAQSVFNATNNIHICSLNLEDCAGLFPEGLSSSEFYTQVVGDSIEEEGSIHELWFSVSGASETYTDEFNLTMGDQNETFVRTMSETQYSVFDNFLIYMGGGGYGAFDVFEFFPLGGDSILVEKSCAGHCNPEAEPTYDVVVRKNRLPHQIFRNVVLDDPNDFANSKFTAVDYIDVIEYQFDNKNQLICERNKNGTPLMFFEFMIPTEKENWMVGDQTLEEVIELHFGFKPTVLLLNVYQFGTFSFVLDDEGSYYQGPSVFLEY